jgi:hypothetical protein
MRMQVDQTRKQNGIAVVMRFFGQLFEKLGRIFVAQFVFEKHIGDVLPFDNYRCVFERWSRHR